MKSKLFGLAALIVAFTAMPSHASTLVDHGSYTTDTNTGLQWLDVTLTQGHSYNDVLANYISPASLYAGYRFASAAEVAQLFSDADISSPYTGPPNGQQSQYQALIALLGTTFATASIEETFGMVSDDFIPGLFQYVAQLFISPTHMTADPQGGAAFDDSGSSDVGSFLVLSPTPTPLPAALPLFATGLGVIGLFGWRRKRKADALAA